MNQITPFLLIGLTLICIAMAAELWHTRVVDSRQMAYISELLEQILQNRPVSYVSEEKDSIKQLLHISLEHRLPIRKIILYY